MPNVSSNKPTLKIFIKGEFFDQISDMEKSTEYRDVGDFWNSRLFDKAGKKRKYDYIEFINGMSTNARRMITQYLGFNKRGDKYHIKIGKIIKRKF